MKFEELNNYIKEQHEKYKDEVKEYYKKLEEYNKQKKEYLKAKDKITTSYDSKIYSIEQAKTKEIEIAQEKVKILNEEGLINHAIKWYYRDDDSCWEWGWYEIDCSVFLGKITDIFQLIKFPENVGMVYDRTTIEGPLPMRIAKDFFIKNIDFFIELKDFDKSFIDYKIIEQIKSLLKDKCNPNTIDNYHQDLKELRLQKASLNQELEEARLQKDFLNQKLEKLEKKMEKRFVLGKRKIRKQIQEIREEIPIIENKIVITERKALIIEREIKDIEDKIKDREVFKEGIEECEKYIEGYKEGKTQKINFKAKEINRLFKLMQESIKVFISKSESIKQKEEKISVLKENKDRALADLPIKEPKEPLPPPRTPAEYIYQSEWAEDEELVKEIKTLKEETLDKDVIEICDRIIKENRRLKEEKFRKL